LKSEDENGTEIAHLRVAYSLQSYLDESSGQLQNLLDAKYTDPETEQKGFNATFASLSLTDAKVCEGFYLKIPRLCYMKL